MRLVTWRAVRSLGELQVLTRASYLILVIVPMLAALWPGVRLVVNRYNEAVAESTRSLEHSSEKLRQGTEALRGELGRLPERLPVRAVEAISAERLRSALAAIDKAALDLERRTREFVDDYPARTLESPRLPPTWAEAFFAALAVLLGHFIYQLAAPDVIRHNSQGQFVSARLDEYAKYRSQAALERARYYRSKVPYYWDPPQPVTASSTDPEEALRRDMTEIEGGSSAEYHYFAQQNPVAILATAVSYLVGLSFIGWIVVRQTQAVAVAAGWMT